VARPNLNYEIRAQDKTSAGLNSVLRKLKGLRSAFAAIGVGAAATGIVRFVQNVSKAADETNKLSDQLGISTESLSQLQHVAQQTGVDFGQFTTGIQRMTRRMSEAANGAGEARGAFKELGIDVKALVQLSPDQQFLKVADALDRVENSSRKVALAQKIFDSEGVKLIRTTKGGAAAIREMMQEADELGATLDGRTADAMTRIQDQNGLLQTAFRGLGYTIAREFAPQLESLNEKLISGFKNLKRWFDFMRESNLNALDSRIMATKQEIAALNAELEKSANKKPGGMYPPDKEAEARRILDAPVLKEIVRLEQELAAAQDERRKLSNEYVDSIKRGSEANREYNESIATGSGGGVISNQKKFNAELAEARRLFEQTRTPQERYNLEAEKLGKLLDKNAISWEVYSRAMLDAEVELEKATKSMTKATKEATDKTKDAFQDLKREIEGVSADLVNILTDTSRGIKGIFEDLATTIAKFAFKRAVTDPLTGALSNILDGIFGGGGIFGRQFGGPVVRDQPVVVGESGRELFVPQSSGQIIPGGGGVTNINFNITSLDPQTAASVIVQNKNVIIGVVRSAFNRAGSEPRLA